MCPANKKISKFYASILAAISLKRSTRAASATRYNNLLLITTFGVFAYRDVWPLATYDKRPSDAAEGPLLWAKIGLLTISARLIPLIIPHRYVPVDPKVSTRTLLRPVCRPPYFIGSNACTECRANMFHFQSIYLFLYEPSRLGGLSY
jgi:hypothetical protein